MICYRDRSWCSRKCGNLDCSRNFTPEEAERAEQWWAGFNQGPGAPISTIDMKDTDGCKEAGGYIEP